MAGNTRLTALTGAVLFVLLAAEGVTILDLHPLFSEHVLIGALLIGPVLLKLASTGYRFVRYYTRNPAYRRKGPPHPMMRMLAPPLIVTTLVLFASGIVLLVLSPARPGPWLFIHKASFVVWLVLAGLHVLVYMWRVPGLVAADLVRPSASAVRGVGSRLLLVGLGLVTGAVAAAILLPLAQPWEHWMTVAR